MQETYLRFSVAERHPVSQEPLGLFSAAAAYAKLKTALALDYSADRAAYTAGKAAFIDRVLATGGAATA